MGNWSTNSELKDVAKLLHRGGWLVLPFVAWQVAEVFLLPADMFTFRVWEAALATPYRYPGAYYPNTYIKKEKEFGDRYRFGNPDEVESKTVEWFVDKFGWRNRPEVEQKEHYDAVLLGDSNIVGSFLDQKDTLSEVMAARSGKTIYSYSIGNDHISLFFSDPRLLIKSPRLLVVETKVGNWETNNSYLSNFYQRKDGTLDVVDRRAEFENFFYAQDRNYFFEKIRSKLLKQPMFNWLQSELALSFKVADRKSEGVFRGSDIVERGIAQEGWSPGNWVVSGAAVQQLGSSPTSPDGWRIRAIASNAFWHTENFLSDRKDGNIVIRFAARATLSPSHHQMHIFENGSYRSIGEFRASTAWRSYEIPISTSPGSALEFQIDQPDVWQWLEVKDFVVVNARPAMEVNGTPVSIAMTEWSGEGAACPEGTVDSCRQWVALPNGYIQTPVLPISNASGIRFTFEARVAKPAQAYSDVYLFEGSAYRKVSQYRFDTTWKQYELLLPIDPTKAVKMQLDLPHDVSSLAIRNVQVAPAVRPAL